MASSFPMDVEFEVIKEDWNIYKLSDGATLRTKLVLGKLVTQPGTNLETTSSFAFETRNIVVAYVPQSMKGPPLGHPLTPQEIQESIVEELNFDPIHEVWNEYHLSNNIILHLKLVLAGVGKTDKYNPDGTPIYATRTQVVPRITRPRGYFERKRKVRRRTSTGTPII